MGVWSAEARSWQPEPVDEVAVGGRLTFRARALGALALLQPRGAMLPFAAWRLRPRGGPVPARVALDLVLGAPRRTGGSVVARPSVAWQLWAQCHALRGVPAGAREFKDRHTACVARTASSFTWEARPCACGV